MAKRRGSSPRRPPRGSTPRAASTSRRLHRAGFVAVALVFVLPPFVVWPSLDEAFRLPKLFASEILAALSLVLLAWRIGPETRRPASILRHPATLASLPFLLVALLGWLAGDHAAFVRPALPSLALGVAVLIGWSVALDDRERWSLLSLVCWPAAILALLVALQYHDIFTPFTFQEQVSDRLGLTSLAGGAYDLAGYLVLPFLILQTRWPRSEGRERILTTAALVVIGYAFVVTTTMTAILAVAAGSLILLARQLPKHQRLRVAGAFLVGLVVISVATPIGKRAGKKVSNLAKSSDWNRFFTGRLDGWQAAGWMFRQHPILGVGHGAFRAEFGQAKLALQDDGVTFYRNHKLPFFTHAHSEPLHIAAEMGLAGLAALAWALVVVVRAVRRRSPPAARDDDGSDDGDDEPANPLATVQVPALVALAILALAYFPFHLALQAFPWLLFLAAVLAPPSAKETDDAEPTAAFGPHLPGRLLTLVVVVLLIATTAATAQRAWRGMAHEAMLKTLEAQASLLWQYRPRVQARQLDTALRKQLDLLDQLAERQPADVRVPMAVGGRYFMLGRYDAAARAYREAAALETRAEVYMNLARSLHKAGDLDAARDATQIVLRLAPRERRTLERLGLLPETDTGKRGDRAAEETHDG